MAEAESSRYFLERSRASIRMVMMVLLDIPLIRSWTRTCRLLARMMVLVSPTAALPDSDDRATIEYLRQGFIWHLGGIAVSERALDVIGVLLLRAMAKVTSSSSYAHF
jgi:hypothetical protein